MSVDDSIVDRLERAAHEGGGRVLFHNDDGVHVLDASLLYDMARQRAARLRAAGIDRGDRVGIIGPNAPDWVAWGYAAWMCGAIEVPLPIPLRIRDRSAVAEQVNALAAGFDCRRVAAHARFASLFPEGLTIEWDDAGSPDDALGPRDLVRLNDHTVARITPTSGSTSAPKGVSRSFEVLNTRVLDSTMNPFGHQELRYLTYAPLAHAAGSVATFGPLEPWLEIHMLSPQRFAREPGELFRLVGPHRLMTMSATSSAIAAALRSVERRPDDVDLSSMEWITFAYEMVDPDVVDRLISVGARFGLRPETIGVFYGLSEGGGTRTELGKPPAIDHVDLDALVTEGVARTAETGSSVKRVVSCGISTRTDLRIANEHGNALPERHVGEVQFRGPRLMQGYVGPGAHEAFLDDGWMHTGDVGYLAHGELYITGRIKEVMVQQGKKYHPEDIEWAAAHGADVAPDQCVAFVPLDAHEGDIVVAIETEAIEDGDELERRVRAAVLNRVGITLRTVLFVTPLSLPKASSGKAQRLAARDRFARGELSPNR